MRALAANVLILTCLASGSAGTEQTAARPHGRESAFGSATVRRYFQSTRYVKGATDPDELAKFHQLTDLFRKYGDRYDIDWLLMTAQGYQESSLNQNAQSKDYVAYELVYSENRK